jgi:ribosomal protein L4
MEFKILDKAGKVSKKTHKASDAIFNNDFNESLIHQIVTSYMSNSRSLPVLKKLDQKLSTAQGSHSVQKDPVPRVRA